MAKRECCLIEPVIVEIARKSRQMYMVKVESGCATVHQHIRGVVAVVVVPLRVLRKCTCIPFVGLVTVLNMALRYCVMCRVDKWNENHFCLSFAFVHDRSFKRFVENKQSWSKEARFFRTKRL